MEYPARLRPSSIVAPFTKASSASTLSSSARGNDICSAASATQMVIACPAMAIHRNSTSSAMLRALAGARSHCAVSLIVAGSGILAPFWLGFEMF